MLKWFYWKNDKNSYKIYGKNDKTLAHFKKKQYLCGRFNLFLLVHEKEQAK